MKTINKLLSVLLALAIVPAFQSCCDDEPEYTPAAQENTAQVFFPSTNSSSINLSSTANSFMVTIARHEAGEAITVPLTVTGNDGNYNVPSSVTFAQNEVTTGIVVTYDPDVVGFDNFCDLTFSISDASYTTQYGLSNYTVTVGIPAPWQSLGMCTFVEDFLTTFYGVENIPYQVEIQENMLQPGFFRLVNAFGEAYPYNDPGDWDDTKDWYLEIHAEDPEGVYMYVQETGMAWSYGMFSVGSMAGMYMQRGTKTFEEAKAEGLCGTYKDGIITFPASTMVISMADYNEGGLYRANTNGAFKVAMPGVVLKDYTIEVAYAGTYSDTKGNVQGVIAELGEVGEDVESVRLAVVEGTDVDLAVDMIRSGNLESVEAAPQAGTILVPFGSEPVAGKYTLVAVAYAENMAQKYASAEFKFTPATSSETWTAKYVGDYTYTKFFGSDEEPAVDEGLTLLQSDSDPTRWKIEHWGYDVDFIFTMDPETGDIYVEDQETGYVHSSYGMVNVIDYATYTDKGEAYSYYDGETGTFNLCVVYYVSAGVFGYGYETFQLTGAATAEASARVLPAKNFKNVKADVKKKSMKRNLNVRRVY